jgi:hypothetical protein
VPSRTHAPSVDWESLNPSIEWLGLPSDRRPVRDGLVAAVRLDHAPVSLLELRFSSKSRGSMLSAIGYRKWQGTVCSLFATGVLFLCPSCSGSSATGEADAALHALVDGGAGTSLDAPIDAFDWTDICWIDGPCGNWTVRCESGTTFQRYETDCDCAKYCDGHPCMGCMCVPVGPLESCPEGQRCMHGVDAPDYCGDPSLPA